MLTGIVALLALGCTGAEESEAAALLSPCHVAGLDAESLCGTVTVYEDRASGAGRELVLRVLVIPAISPYPRPDPLFFLAGGPGQAASEVAGTILPALTQVQRRRDLVFVDQRGTGQSNGLRCPSDDSLGLREQLELDPIVETRACRDALLADADLQLYTTDFAVDDLEAVRQAALRHPQGHQEHPRTRITQGKSRTLLQTASRVLSINPQNIRNKYIELIFD